MFKASNATSVFKGVRCRGNKWQCRVGYKNSDGCYKSYTKFFPTEIEAAKHYREKAVEFHGAFANFGQTFD
jgi:hypothetical protein